MKEKLVNNFWPQYPPNLACEELAVAQFENTSTHTFRNQEPGIGVAVLFHEHTSDARCNGRDDEKPSRIHIRKPSTFGHLFFFPSLFLSLSFSCPLL